MAELIKTEQQREHFKEFFGAFLETLRDDHMGEGPKQHMTNYPVYIVQRERLITGIDTQFTDKLCAIDHDGDVYFSPLEAWKTFTEMDELDVISDTTLVDEEPALVEAMENMGIECFSDASDDQKWDLVRAIEGISFVTGYDTLWEFESAHLTSASAEHKKQRLENRRYNSKYRIYIESNHDDDEYKQIVNAILSGLLAPVNT